jgi:hypothetical protein
VLRRSDALGRIGGQDGGMLKVGDMVRCEDGSQGRIILIVAAGIEAVVQVYREGKGGWLITLPLYTLSLMEPNPGHSR